MDKIDKIINIIRTLKEEGMMTTSSTTNKAGFGGSSQGFDPGPTAGYDKLLDGRSKMMRRLPPEYRKGLQKSKRKNKNK
jgi:hypothetical protein